MSCPMEVKYTFYLNESKEKVKFLITDHYGIIDDSFSLHSNQFPICIDLSHEQLEDLRQACIVALRKRFERLQEIKEKAKAL